MRIRDTNPSRCKKKKEGKKSERKTHEFYAWNKICVYNEEGEVENREEPTREA